MFVFKLRVKRWKNSWGIVAKYRAKLDESINSPPKVIRKSMVFW